MATAKYKIFSQYKIGSQPWRNMTDWVWAKDQRDAVKQFKRGGAPWVETAKGTKLLKKFRRVSAMKMIKDENPRRR